MWPLLFVMRENNQKIMGEKSCEITSFVIGNGDRRGIFCLVFCKKCGYNV